MPQSQPKPLAATCWKKPVTNIIVVGQIPPPVHGQSAMILKLLDGNYERMRLHHVRMAFSKSTAGVGRFHPGKVAHLFLAVGGIYIQRFRTGSRTLYYPPAGPAILPVIRDIFILLLTRCLFRVTVFHFHAAGLADFVDRSPAPLRFLARLAYRKATLSIGLSKDGPADGSRLGACHELIIPYGIEDHAKHFCPSSPKTGLRILFAGVLRESKGVLTLLDACELLCSRHVPFSLEILGPFSDGDFERIVRARVCDPIYGGAIRLLGELHDANKWSAFSRANVFCFPSHYEAESLSLVLLEAMMMSLPIVTTRWRGLPTLVEDECNGFLIPPRQPIPVADSLAKLAFDSDLRKVMAAESRRRFEESHGIALWRQRMEGALTSLE